MQPTQTPQTPAAPTPPKTTETKVLEAFVPINRSAWAVAAGWIALFNIPFVITAPVGIVFAILGLRSIKQHPEKIGKGRCWFAIVYGAAVLLFVIIIFSGALSHHS